MLAVDLQRLPARCQHSQPRALLEERIEQLGDVFDHMLAVVDDQQRLTRCQVRRELVRRRRPLVDSDLERGRERARDRGVVGDRREVDEPDPFGMGRDFLMGDLDREPGLATPTHSRQGHELLRREEPTHRDNRLLTTDERRPR